MAFIHRFGSALNPHLHFNCVVLDGVFASAKTDYCALPPFALERLQQRDAGHLLYAASKPGPGDCGPQLLTALQLIDRLAALVPPPRVHRDRYVGVLAPNAPLRVAVATR